MKFLYLYRDPRTGKYRTALLWSSCTYIGTPELENIDCLTVKFLYLYRDPRTGKYRLPYCEVLVLTNTVFNSGGIRYKEVACLSAWLTVTQENRWNERSCHTADYEHSSSAARWWDVEMTPVTDDYNRGRSLVRCFTGSGYYWCR